MRRALPVRLLVALAVAVAAAAVGANAARALSGGTYTTFTGERVRVLASDLYAVDDVRNQQWADFLAKLVHGSELATVTLVLAHPLEVSAVCGAGAFGCYAYPPGVIVASPEPLDGVAPETTIAHEYAHHILSSRLNSPWDTFDWGTKRWASYVGICALEEAGRVAPGDQAERYTVNPGEAFAEAYRLLNERRLGLAESPWEFVDPLFFPDARALQLLEQDVLSPWERATTITRSGRATYAGATSMKLQTPLDGRLAATVRSATPVQVELVLGGTVLSRATGRVAAVRADVCGTRTATLRVRSTKGATRYRATIARP